MKKTKFKSKAIDADLDEEEHLESGINPKIELLSKIGNLKNFANDSLLQNDYDKAIGYSEKIIRLAIKHNIDNEIGDQQMFMKLIAEKVQHDYFISEINETVAKIQKIYNILINLNNFIQAHEIFETFLNNYKDKIDVNQLPQLKSLIDKDKKEWIKYYTQE